MDRQEYYSCDWLEGGIAFAPRGIYACCVCHHGNRGWPYFADFNGGKISAYAVKSGRKLITQGNQTGTYENCKGCPLLVKRPYQEKEYLFDMINLSHSTVCNLRCSYCYLQKPKTGKDWWNNETMINAGKKPINLYPTFCAMIEERLLSPNAVIYWGGGEPVLLQEFDKLLDWTIKFGMSNVIATNCTIFSKSIRDGLLTGKVRISCSIDAGTAETFQRLKKSKSFDNIWKNLSEYAATGGQVEAKYIFLEDNCNENDILNFIKLAKQNRIKRIVCDVDAFDPKISNKILNAISLVRSEAMKGGIAAVIEGSGIVGFPEKDVTCKSQGIKGSVKE
jgi:sulfatase maturation enzyme AslB (radical SAM superfamily)